ncbi:MAG: NADH-quinone oxidoreductase subunit NuoE [Candidatus Thermoplasmatota archaeon]|nr:NADH-quinone oxidoreductase subunit NuoE [Candidatus Thermoplasmatota archaeon]
MMGGTTTGQVLSAFEKKPEHVIAILQRLQQEKKYLSEEDIDGIARYLGMSPNEVYGVATFYTQFKFHPPGKHHIAVCMGTACHVKASDELLDVVKNELDIAPGETSEDGMFSLDRVACLGCCALSPVVTIDGDVHGRMTPARLLGLLRGLEEE